MHSMTVLKNFPKDLSLVIFLAILCIPFVLISPLNETPIRIILGLPLVLFLPGYSLIATLFPRKDDLDGIERIALGFGLSIVISPLLCLALNYTPFGIRLLPILIALSVFTISVAIGAYIRRSMVIEGARFTVEFSACFKNIQTTLKSNQKLTDNQKKLLSAIIFFISYGFLLRFIYLFGNGIPQSFIFFWIPVLLIFACPLYKIVTFKGESNWLPLILFEIILIAFIVRAIRIFTLKDALPGLDDGYIILYSTEFIKQHQDFLFTGPDVAKWPFTQLLTIVISEISNITLFNCALFFPSILTSIAVVFVYLIANEVYGDKKVALLSCLAFSPYFYSASIGARFQYQNLAFVFLLICLFLFFKNVNVKKLEFIALTLIFIFGVTLSHHLTNIFLVGFFVIMLLSALLLNGFIKLISSKKFKTPFLIVKKELYAPSLFFVILASVIVLAYLMYVGMPFFDFLAHAFEDLGAPSLSSTSPFYTPSAPSKPEIKDYILSRGDIFFVILFGSLLMYEVFIRRDCKYWRSDFMLASWIAFSFFLYLLTLPNPQMGGSPSRILPFTYVFILIAIPHIILSRKPLMIKKFIIVLAFWVIFTFLLYLISFSNTQIETLLSKILAHTYNFIFIAIPLVILSQKPAMVKRFLILLLLGFMVLNVYQLTYVPSSPLAKTFFPPEYGDYTQENAVVRWQKMEPGTSPLTITEARIFCPFVYEQGWIPCRGIGTLQNKETRRLIDRLYINPKNPRFMSSGQMYTSKYPRLDEETSSLIQTEFYTVYNNGEWEICCYHK